LFNLVESNLPAVDVSADEPRPLSDRMALLLLALAGATAVVCVLIFGMPS
jgi:hypothetical protein